MSATVISERSHFQLPSAPDVQNQKNSKFQRNYFNCKIMLILTNFCGKKSLFLLLNVILQKSRLSRKRCFVERKSRNFRYPKRGNGAVNHHIPDHIQLSKVRKEGSVTFAHKSSHVKFETVFDHLNDARFESNFGRTSRAERSFVQHKPHPANVFRFREKLDFPRKT